ncbi:DUF3375 domain-containing protein [Micrococcus sp. FDAARGOS_333]|uniref:DUF3375 domain-containing protein n=1 Tax=Micrococcus sp. FDAARGOS_333 TaxID=1930558 RepID=UPI000C9E5128|nr:DUF3375 domain-containing protein [Micrococcus sp. FDAARGOS_333]PNL16988.1 DUF3375 domain-containing protein [Micrococcus sp. FDAARGOS_333]
MTSLAVALQVRRLVQDDAALRMLRMDSLPLVAGVLETHLSAPNATMPTHQLHDLLDAELDPLRTHLDLSDRTAKGFCEDWRQAGLLERRLHGESREEVYALTPAARQGLRLIEQLLEPRASVTESRFVALLTALHRLAVETDPDVDRRVAALQAERDRLDERIRRLSSGEDDLLDERRARERLEDLLGQAADLPTDFARVRARFSQLNQELRRRILTDEGLPKEVLENVFRGVDVIESSDEGQTFAAFSRLVRDPAMAASFEADVRAVLGRDLFTDLPASVRSTLRTLPRTLDDGARSVQDSLTEFARGLRGYVLSQEYQRDRRLHTALQEALAAAAEAAPATRPFHRTGLDMELTGMSPRSLGTLTLHDPREFDVGAALEEAEVETVDVEALRLLARETEIDFAELRENVNGVLADHSPVSVAEVLSLHPATQGVASVVGLLSLAARHGVIDDDATDLLRWPVETENSETPGSGLPHRSARVVRHLFTERLP